MNTTELRIGNLVNWRGKKWDISLVDFYDMYACGDEINKHYSPIPLTEEWLVNFRFEVKIDMARLSGDDIQTFEMRWFGKLGWYYTGDSGCMSGNELKHVHQLQNLYYALTNKELTIK